MEMVGVVGVSVGEEEEDLLACEGGGLAEQTYGLAEQTYMNADQTFMNVSNAMVLWCSRRKRVVPVSVVVVGTLLVVVVVAW